MTALSQVRGSPTSSIVAAHEPRPKRTVDMLVRGAVDGVDGAVSRLQPLTVEQVRHHVEKVHGEQVSVSGREAHCYLQKKRLLEQRFGIPVKAEEAGVRAYVPK